MESLPFAPINQRTFTHILRPSESLFQKYHVTYRGVIKITQLKKLGYGLKKRFLGLWKQQSEYHFVITDAVTGSILGGCGLDEVNWVNQTANLGYWVRTSRTRQGIATAASRLLACFGFAQLRLKRIDVVTSIENVPSARVIQKLNPSEKKRVKDDSSLNSGIPDTIVSSLFPQDIL